jgi:hypothetical protein
MNESPYFSIVAMLANEIYFQKCVFFSVSELPHDEERDCLIKAVQILPAFLETYKKYVDFFGATATRKGEE